MTKCPKSASWVFAGTAPGRTMPVRLTRRCMCGRDQQTDHPGRSGGGGGWLGWTLGCLSMSEAGSRGRG